MLVTLDTNVVRDALDHKRPGHSHARSIMDLAQKRSLTLQVTSRIVSDVREDPLRAKISSLPELQSFRPGTAFRVGHSCVGSTDTICDLGDRQDQQLMDLLFPGASPQGRHQHNRWADVDHLLAHRASGAAFFITDDQAILDQHAKLKRGYQIDVISPVGFLEQLH